MKEKGDKLGTPLLILITGCILLTGIFFSHEAVAQSKYSSATKNIDRILITQNLRFDSVKMTE